MALRAVAPRMAGFAPELNGDFFRANPPVRDLLQRMNQQLKDLQSQIDVLPPRSSLAAVVANDLVWIVPGTLVEDGRPGGSAVPVILKEDIADVAFEAKIITAPTGLAVTVQIGRTPAGGARVVVGTLTIPVGMRMSPPSVAISFTALDTVDIQIMQVGSIEAGIGLVVGQVAA